MSNDAQKVLESVMYILNGTYAPLQVIGVLIYMIILIQEYALVAMAVFLVFLPVNM